MEVVFTDLLNVAIDVSVMMGFSKAFCVPYLRTQQIALGKSAPPGCAFGPDYRIFGH